MDFKLVYVCLSVVGMVTSQQDHADVEPPCFVRDFGNFEAGVDLNVSLRAIAYQLHDLKVFSENLTLEMERRFSMGGLENASFLNNSFRPNFVEKLTFIRNLCSNRAAFLQTLNLHYEYLNGLATFFEYVPHILLEQRNLDFSKRLNSLQMDMYRCMCRMKIILRSNNHDPKSRVPSDTLPSAFLLLVGGTREEQLISKYVNVLDSSRITDYLLSFYGQFNKSLSTCQTYHKELIG